MVGCRQAEFALLEVLLLLDHSLVGNLDAVDRAILNGTCLSVPHAQLVDAGGQRVVTTTVTGVLVIHNSVPFPVLVVPLVDIGFQRRPAVMVSCRQAELAFLKVLFCRKGRCSEYTRQQQHCSDLRLRNHAAFSFRSPFSVPNVFTQARSYCDVAFSGLFARRISVVSIKDPLVTFTSRDSRSK